jgi:hypothetical protein
MGTKERGVYGFRLATRDHETELPHLGPIDAGAATVSVDWRHATVLTERQRIDDDCVSIGRRNGAGLEVRRDPPSVMIESPEFPTPESLVHPFLTVPMSILARWRGDLTLHAGGFFAHGHAWAVLGPKEAGKSTMLAELGLHERPLLADDLLVLTEHVVRAGPACVDLRPDVAMHIPGARFLGEVGERPRYRLSTLHGPARAQLGGFFLLDWSDNRHVSVEPIPVGESLRIVYEHEYLGFLGPADPRKILDLLEVPMWRVRRPRDWSFTDAAIDRMLEVTARGDV